MCVNSLVVPKCVKPRLHDAIIISETGNEIFISEIFVAEISQTRPHCDMHV